MSRRPRKIDDEPPRYMERGGSHRAYQTRIAVEPESRAWEMARLRADAPSIVARALARGWAKMPATTPQEDEAP